MHHTRRTLRSALAIALAATLLGLGAGNAAGLKVYNGGGGLVANGTPFTLTQSTGWLMFSDGGAMNDRCGSGTISGTVANNGLDGNPIRFSITGWTLSGCTHPTTVGGLVAPVVTIPQGGMTPSPGTMGTVNVSIAFGGGSCNLIGNLTATWVNGTPSTLTLGGTLGSIAIPPPAVCGSSTLTSGGHTVATVNGPPGNLRITP